MLRWFKDRKRKKIQRRVFPEAWRGIMDRNVPFVHLLPSRDREELKKHILVFLEEKRFEGAGGLKITDEIKVTIAAQACLLLLHRKTDYYPGLYSIIVYPHAYVDRRPVQEKHGIVAVGGRPRLGESWLQGPVVLSWAHVLADAADIHDGHNVVLHEFAHQLDAQDGAMDGAPVLSDHALYADWTRVLGKEYGRLQRDTALGKETLLDRYGATHPAEFFAVATEFFFEKPLQLRQRIPDLYEELRRYYKQDPARFFA